MLFGCVNIDGNTGVKVHFGVRGLFSNLSVFKEISACENIPASHGSDITHYIKSNMRFETNTELHSLSIKGLTVNK